MIPATKIDFEMQVLEAGVNYTFLRLSNDKCVARSAPLARDATVRHAGPSGDTG